jgi:hypothetical protein
MDPEKKQPLPRTSKEECPPLQRSPHSISASMTLNQMLSNLSAKSLGLAKSNCFSTKINTASSAKIMVLPILRKSLAAAAQSRTLKAK